MSPTRRSLLRLSGVALASTAGCLGSLGSPGAQVSIPDDAPDALRWAYETTGDVRQPPAVTDDAVYVPSGRLFALNHDGTKRWSVETADGAFGTPSVADAVYFTDIRASRGRRDDAVRAIEFDGSERWTFEPGGNLVLLGVADGLAYVNTMSDYSAAEGFTLYAVNAETGEKEWEAEVGAPSEIHISGDTVVVASDGAVRAFETDGTKRWERQADVESIAGIRGDALVADGRSSVTAFDTDDGSERWEVTNEDRTVTDAILRDDVAYVAEYSTLSAFDLEDGEHLWRSAEHDSQHYYIAEAADGVVYTSGGKGVAAVDATTGAERWTWSDGANAIYAEQWNDVLYVSGDSRLAAVGTDGEERWRFRADGSDAALYRPNVSDAGCYVGNEDGTVYGFET